MEGTGTIRASGDVSQKVIAIAAGEAHTLALAGDGSLYSWGRGMFGRLGTGSEADQLFPTRIDFFDSADEGEKLKIVAISAGAYHSLALADDGSVWCWGFNVYGQLGLSGDNSSVPHILEGFLELGSPNLSKDNSVTESRLPLKVSSIKAGSMMSMAIDSLGGLWMWGNCPLIGNSNEGSFSLSSISTPIPVWSFHGHTVVKVACGNEHVVALVSPGETYDGTDLLCYSWGNNQHGQLGLGDKESRLAPEVIQTFNLESSWAVYEIACGSLHTVLLAHGKGASNMLKSVCWTFGLGGNGQLGHGTTQSYMSPEPVKGLPENVFLISVDCGLFHTSVVSSAGNVWSWGMEKGLGLCPNASFTGTDPGDAISPVSISSNSGPTEFTEPIQVECGAAHTVLVADAGYKLWSWGRGWSGVLGNGKMVDCFIPTMILWPPLIEDFKKKELDNLSGNEKSEAKDHKENAAMEKKLALVQEEIKHLRSKLTVREQYASILHGAIFGKPFEEKDIPVSLQTSGTFDIAREWENMLDSLDHHKLTGLEMFYRSMLTGVKDKIMKRRIQEMIKECLNLDERS